MTVIHPNSISGITSVTSHSNSLYLYESDHSTKLTINAHVNGNTSGTASNLTGSPSINVTNITASGNVSIGGTLTYEDVTNIDSVGIITAQSNVVIADKIIHLGDTNTALRFPANNTFTVETSGSEAFRVDSSQRLLLGNTSSRSNAPGADVGFQIEGASGGPTNKRFIQYIFGSGDGSGPYLGLAKHRGTSVGGNTIVVNGDELGGIYFQGADGTNFKQGASILGFVDGTPGSNDMPGRLSFQTTSDGASSPTERLRITSDGYARLTTANARLEWTASSGSNPFIRSIGSGQQELEFNTGGAERLRITSAGDLFVAGTGGSGDTTQLPNGSTININGNSSNDGFSIIRYSGGYGAYGLNIGRSKSGTVGTNAAVTDGNDLGHITFYGADGSSYLKASMITAQVDGTPSAGSGMPGRLIFKTSPDGSATPEERLRITSGGNVGINETNPRAKFDVRGTALIADDIGSTLPSTFPASNVQLMVYTSTNGQPVTNTNCARLLIATDAKQTGAQGYNGALDFGNSDCSASGDAGQFNYRLASIMSNASDDTSNTTGDGNLQFWTKTSTGTLTERVRIRSSGNMVSNQAIYGKFQVCQIRKGSDVSTGNKTPTTSQTEISSSYRTGMTLYTTNPFIRVTWICNGELDGTMTRAGMRFYYRINNTGSWSALGQGHFFGSPEDQNIEQACASTIMHMHQITANVGNVVTVTPYWAVEATTSANINFGQNFASFGGNMASYLILEEIVSDDGGI